MDELSIINRTYELYKSIIDTTYHLEKRWRYSIGQRLEKNILDLMQELIMAKNAPRPLKSAYLLRANSYLELSIFLFRLLLELNIANETKIFQTQEKLSEIGRMLGGWLKSLN